MNNTGILYVVATPIGNLEDITIRALRILKEVDFILCEDKRVTVKLLSKYDIKTRLISFHKFNEEKNKEYVLKLLNSGNNIALVSDAGTPLVADPGGALISFLLSNNIRAIPIPGPSSLVTALSMLPIEIKEFLFIGFLPDQKSKRKEILDSLEDRTKLVIIFLPPHDIEKYVNEINDIYPRVRIFYARELTKINEEFWIGEINELKEIIKNKRFRGEIILGIIFDSKKNIVVDEKELFKMIESLLSNGSSLKEASKTIGNKLNLSKSEIYNSYIKKKKAS